MKNILKVVIATFILAVAMLTQVPNSGVKAAAAEKTGIVTVDNVNVYKGPGKSFGITGGKVFKGELVKYYQTTNGWTYAVSENDQGWIWGEYVQASTGVGVLNNAWANLYKGAGSGTGTQGRINQGTSVVMFESKNGWRHIHANGQESWVWGDFVSKSSGVGTISTSYANLYKGAGSKYGTKGSVNHGTTVKLAELKNGWRHVYMDGQEAWVWDGNISKGSYLTAYEGKITNPSYVNAYQSNGKNNGIKGRVNNGEKVTVYQNSGGWTYIQGRNIEGWVWNTYVNPIHKTGTITNTTFANVYNKANGSSGTKGRINQGDTVAVFEQQNGWKKVMSGDTTGWVWGEFVLNEMVTPSNEFGVETTSANVNVYRGPAKSYSTIGSIPMDSVVSIYQLQNGWRYVHAGYIEGWVWGEYVDPLGGITVFLDPGHGQNDPGAIGFGLKEKDAVLDIGLKARALFNNKSPLNIMMTRSADSSEVTANGKDISTSDSLKLRTDYAKKHKKSNDDIFISLHANAFNGNADGGESYYYSSFSARAVNPHSADSKLLAESIQARLVEYMKLKDRGVKEGNFAVLRENVMPATLIEMGFIDNKSDNDKLKDDYWRNQAARAVYQGTLDYYKKKGFKVDSYGL
ncbi:N-acetylmuramoyl-L-alanine amidase [Cytobacillus purgationiresistens]|uniref:N-acetylmuramoyl-L-alanine amidase n=1 Tax=Cytobacillus purgationiresistens TaxID=863449 RepID=A0ABU0AFC0_9BACI|nr:N-acetylmuramoyl-L-alanine amidase [Cytobacillus purgationiresistens]MDQ0269133.1 N-acetylmuramoyl-L-alanine amidase [Cytobacillus purgationiresistens]